MSLFRHTKKTPEAEGSLSAADINAVLYNRNVELSTKNKALSLLGKLYETSILTLEPKDLARTITEAVRTALNYELVSIYLYSEKDDKIYKIGLSVSERLSDELRVTGQNLADISIEHVSQASFFKSVITDHQPEVDKKFGYVLKNILPEKEVGLLAERAHLKASLVYPLAINGHTLGIMVISLNREYEDLPEYERDIIASVVNVTSLAVDKLLIYDELRIANEKLKSLDKLKTEFLSLASHQLRSPLTAIRGYTSMLLDGSFGEVGEKQKEAINRVFESSTHLTKVVEDLLNVSKIEQGGMKYEMADFDLEKVARDLSADLSITAQKKGLALVFQTDQKSPYSMNGDMEKIRQVVLNIIDNAIKYTEHGSITVSLSKNIPAKTLALAVIDTGMGISPEEKTKLFEKFSRGAGGKTNTGGSGLGLYLAKQIAEAHGGHIAIDSPGTGLGSTFTIEFKGL